MGSPEIVEISFAADEASEETNKAPDNFDWGGDSVDMREGSVDEPSISISALGSVVSGGRWKLAIFLLANYGLATLAFFGVGVNLVVFLTRVMQQSNAVAANNVSRWTGTIYIFSLVGVFVGDYWGRYLTCTIFQLIFLVGLTLLSLTSHVLILQPTGCGDRETQCEPISLVGTAFFYLSIYMIALGSGGYQTVIAMFGSDQFEESVHRQTSKSKVLTFFGYYYFARNFTALYSNTILAYLEDSGKWTVGFWSSTGAAAVALALFLTISPWYRHFGSCGNPSTRIFQVLVAAVRKHHLAVPRNADELHELDGMELILAGNRKPIRHTQRFRCLDKAATMTRDEHYMKTDPWRLCTVTQVEEVKCVVRMVPIWLCTVIHSVVVAQMASLFVVQGESMSKTNIIGGFRIPPASMSIFDILAVLICLLSYKRVFVYVASCCNLSGKPGSLSNQLRRMGVGLVLGMLAMVTAGVVEIMRLQNVIGSGLHEARSTLSILWQIPQYMLIGVCEVMMYIGQLEFFYGQLPDSISSFGSSLYMASISLGSYVSSLLVTIVMTFTSSQQKGRHGWISQDLNNGHLDRFFFLLAALAFLDFLLFLFCIKCYNCSTKERRREGGGRRRG